MAEDENDKPKAEWNAGLNTKERRFVEEYLVDFNGKQAAIRAGYSVKASDAIQNRLRKRPRIAVAVNQLLAEKGISQLRLLEETAKIAFANVGDYLKVEDGHVIIFDTSKLSPEQMAAVSEISETKTEWGSTIKLALHSKLTALQFLFKFAGAFVDKQEISGPNGGPIEVKEADPLDRINERLAALRKAREAAAEAEKEG